MRKIFLVLIAGSLSGCALLPALTGMSSLPRPQAVADRTSLDEAGALSVETLYAATARVGALAFRSGLITPSTNPAIQLDNFCEVVNAGAFEPTDRGSQVSALECKLRAFRDATRAAYRAGNSADYATAIRNAVAAGRELLALIRS